MNDKERTNYFRRKLSEIKDSPTNNPILVNDEEGTVGEKKNTVTNSLFRTVFVFLAFYGTQYIIFDKLANHIKATAKKLNIKIVWGGDWKFLDKPHYEKV